MQQSAMIRLDGISEGDAVISNHDLYDQDFHAWAEQRDQIDTLLRQSPSIKRLVGEYLGYAYPKARRSAAHETGLAQDVFPTQCPFSELDLLDPEFWPDR